MPQHPQLELREGAEAEEEATHDLQVSSLPRGEARAVKQPLNQLVQRSTLHLHTEQRATRIALR